MANFAFVNIVLLALFSSSLGLTLSDVLGFGNLRQSVLKEPEVVEIVRWRQPVCLSPAPGVLPCSVNVHNSGTYQAKVIGPAQTKTDLLEKLNRDDAAQDSSSSESIEQDDFQLRRTTRASSIPKLLSPRIVRSLPLENMGASTLNQPEVVVNSERRERYLKLSPQLLRAASNRQTVYVDKVIDSQIIANLVATTCVPDIGIPLCETHNHQEKPGGYYDHENHSVATVASTMIEEQQVTTAPSVVQNIADLLNRPDVVQTGETPGVKPVVVVRPTPPPGFFDGINAFFLQNGSWFGVFNRPNQDGTQGGGGIPGFPQFPQIPGLQQILYRPENEISEPPNILSILSLTGNQNNQPGAGPPTQSPGIFGGLFASPARPQGINEEVTTPTSILDGIGNLFRPTSRPLVIETPNERPIVIQQPIYVAETPVVPGILDIFQNPNRPVQVNSNEKPQVITDPVYVLQKPTQSPPLFGGGLLPNWNIFGQSNNGSSPTSTSENPTIVVHQNPHPSQTYVNRPDSAVINHDLPTFPDPPNAKPTVIEVSATSLTSVSVSKSHLEEDTKSDISESGSLEVPAEASAKRHESLKSPETVSEETESATGSLKDIVEVDVETVVTGSNTGSIVVEDFSDVTATTEITENHGYKNLNNLGVKEETDNET